MTEEQKIRLKYLKRKYFLIYVLIPGMFKFSTSKPFVYKEIVESAKIMRQLQTMY